MCSIKITNYTLEFYVDDNHRSPCLEWLDSLDIALQARIRKRLVRIEQGNFGDCKPIGNGLYELRFFFGAGYRIYFGKRHNRLVILLCGGDKKTQGNDIKLAEAFWDNAGRKVT